MHDDAQINEDTGKPEIIMDYNRTKGGVDSVDKMCETYNVARGTNRWPMWFLVVWIASYRGYSTQKLATLLAAAPTYARDATLPPAPPSPAAQSVSIYQAIRTLDFFPSVFAANLFWSLEYSTWCLNLNYKKSRNKLISNNDNAGSSRHNTDIESPSGYNTHNTGPSGYNTHNIESSDYNIHNAGPSGGSSAYNIHNAGPSGYSTRNAGSSDNNLHSAGPSDFNTRNAELSGNNPPVLEEPILNSELPNAIQKNDS
ncbi:hypothetical protein EVAR_88806_1 [Eumeta japonica]|uniref:PiggyBac transposable element-derived protein domain-containing protein n=1 Tax=Eumeta variegata TaxID=151549 RepID=A0A4C1YJG9_EUMVA|nr:hypothetical protein EVAR_88806_1 [Eumeta japonica]